LGQEINTVSVLTWERGPQEQKY